MRQPRNRYFALGDVLLLAAAAYVSYVLRLERFDIDTYWPGLLLFGGTAVVVIPLLYWRTGVYSRYWQYATAEDVLLLLAVTTFGVILASIVSRLLDSLIPGGSVVPRSIPLIYILLAVAVTIGQRLSILLIARYTRGRRSQVHMLRRRLMPGYLAPLTTGGVAAIPVLVVGAGAAGSMIVRELQSNPQLGMHVVGFLDDDLTKLKLLIHGTPVLGTRHDIERVVREYAVQRVIIAMPTASGKVIREIVHTCEEIDVQTSTIPGIYELLGGKVSVDQLRSVQVEDLLRRDPILIDTTTIREMIAGKSVLVTGAGGSIGSELCRQVFKFGPCKLVLLGHGENSIFEIDNELKRLASLGKPNGVHGESTPVVVPVIADIRHRHQILRVIQEHRPDIVFHAAAHKHVPLMEANPAEAVANNVTGTQTVVEAAAACGVERFVLISTDKAVNPTSIMGATKRVAELLVHEAASKTRRPYVAVRFGNVLGSRGSVVLTFKQQIASGGPVTVTHPEMVRFFMTIPEAVQLVLQAAAIGRGGEVFMLDMGDPVRIVDLARDLIELSGLQVGHDIDIVFTGMRPGEKLYEELFAKGEKYARTRHEKIYIVANASSLVPPNLPKAIGELQALAEKSNTPGIERQLRSIVPQYRPERSGQASAPPTGNGSSQQEAVQSTSRPNVHRSIQEAETALSALQPEDTGIAQV